LLLSPARRFGNEAHWRDNGPMELSQHEGETPTGAASFVQSEMFTRTFREGMALVEETANYLDGEGREASKSLSRSGALSYAGASMRLTTQLMQIASWLLVLRAVRDDDLSIVEAGEPKYRLSRRDSVPVDLISGELPVTLVTLIDAAAHLYDRIARLDADLFLAREKTTQPSNDAAAQQRALLDAFGGRG
jgi:regulator of CtrA degradation